MSSSPTLKSNHSPPTRSVSLPFESNPVVQRVTRELNNLRKWEESSSSTTESLTIGFTGVTDLYKCISYILTLPITQQALSLPQHRPSITQLIHGADKLHQLCASSRDLASHLKEASSNLRSSLFQDTHQPQLSVSTFISSKRNIAKGAKHLLSSLKKIETESFISSKSTLNISGDADHHRLSTVMNMLTCVGIITISILESLLMFLAIPVSQPTTYSKRSSLISRVLMKRDYETESIHQREAKNIGSNNNELKNIYVALCVLCPNSVDVLIEEEKVRLVCTNLEALEVGIQGIVNGLDGVSRRLVLNRASLLQISNSL